ncbi:MAG TPA: hypothetical protein VMU94_04175 [Streptosporangiaceae bacterium]|nr:hypothetical protein [Streptosporangiaceae bacterium]
MTDTPPASGRTPRFPQPALPGFWPPEAGQPGYGMPGYPPPGQQGGWGAGVAPAPGGIPLRPLGVGDILSGAFSLIRQNPAATMRLTASIATTLSVVMVGTAAGYPASPPVS